MSGPSMILVDDLLSEDKPSQGYLEWWREAFSERLHADDKIIWIWSSPQKSDRPSEHPL